MLRGSKSRNKVSVGEPAEGSLPHFAELLFVEELCRHPPHVNIEMFDTLNISSPLCSEQLIVDWVSGSVARRVSFCDALWLSVLRLSNTQTQPKLLTMDILVLATMKNAAKCDTQCELQNSVNHQNFERILRSEVFLRACLSQWHLPLSPSGFCTCEGGRSASRQSLCLLVEHVAVSLQEQSWPAWRHENCHCPA